MSNEAGLSLAGAHADSAVDLVAGTIRELLHELHRALAVHLQVLVSVAEVSEAALAIAAVEEVDSEAVAEAAVAASEEVEGTAVWDMEDQTAHHPDHVKEEDSEEAETTVAHQEAAADETMQTSSLSHQEEATTAEEVEATVIETETSAVAQRGHSRGATMTHDKDDATNGSMERGKILPTNHSTPKGKYTDRCSSWQPLILKVASSWTRWDVLYTPCTSRRSIAASSVQKSILTVSRITSSRVRYRLARKRQYCMIHRRNHSKTRDGRTGFREAPFSFYLCYCYFFVAVGCCIHYEARTSVALPGFRKQIGMYLCNSSLHSGRSLRIVWPRA